jgi:hypothetical protein
LYNKNFPYNFLTDFCLFIFPFSSLPNFTMSTTSTPSKKTISKEEWEKKLADVKINKQYVRLATVASFIHYNFTHLRFMYTHYIEISTSS